MIERAQSRVLVVEDDDAMREMLVEEISSAGFAAEAVGRAKDGIERVGKGGIDLIVTDLRMPEIDGFDLIRDVYATGEAPHIIMITAFGSIDTAVRAVKLGAFDYITKPFEVEQLLLVLDKAAADRALRAEVEFWKGQALGRVELEGMIANTPEMHEVLELASRVADTNIPVLVTGESGTGKEVIARAIHQASSRKDAPFVPVNVGALPENLMESELFGAMAGAFTDAKTERLGVFREAHTGTLFLDEIGELPMAMQSKLLRALQEGEIRPLGASGSQNVDVRVLAATNRDLEEMLAQGTFREDLYYRLNVVEIAMPPLRHRRGDVLALAELFLRRVGASYTPPRTVSLSPEVSDLFLSYAWPGNVRELENVIERGVALAKRGQLLVTDLPAALSDPKPHRLLEDAVSERMTLADLERRYIQAVLHDEGGHRTNTAKRLGLDRKTLYRKLEEYKD